MLLILVFNFVGYKFVLQYLEQRSIQALNQNIDSSNYNERDLVEVTIPLQMPYYSDSKQEHIQGELSFGGMNYNYVKRQVINNILHIWCLPNVQKTKLQKLNQNVAKSVANNKNQDSKQSFSITKSLDNDYEAPLNFGFLKEYIVSQTITIPVSNFDCKSLFIPQKTVKPPNTI